jgi:EAL domain-containing protein (putative c-di-GMP-specific phosphodiesterase class I)
MNPADNNFAHLSVLVVEDHDFQRRVALAMLKQLAVTRVQEAINGHEALARLRESGSAVDVIVCDLQMPGMDGIEFIRRVAEERLSASVILLSGLESALLSSVEIMARSYGIRMLGAIEKPVTAQKLANLLARHRMAGPQTYATPVQVTEEEIACGIARGEFVPYFQPKVDLGSQRVVGAESLIRWQHPKHGLLLPAVFIDRVDAAGLGGPFTEIVIDRSLAAYRGWRERGMEISLSINLSLRFLEVVGVAEAILARFSNGPAKPADIIIEITESLATTQYAKVLENLARLRMNGFGISIDDYGTGYSSVQQLSRIPFTELKLDKSFVSGAAAKPSMRAILESALQLAGKLKLKSVAEGIEREEEWLLLKSLGCDMAQGYYVSHAMPAEEFELWYNDWNISLPQA